MPTLLLSQRASPCYIRKARPQTETTLIGKKIRFDLKNQYDPSRPFQRHNIQLMCIGQGFGCGHLHLARCTVNME